MSHFIKTGFWEEKAKGLKGWLNLDQLIAGIANAPAFSSITGQPTDNTNLSTALAAKSTIINSAVALVDGASMTLTATKQMLTSSSATRTFIITYTGDDITLEVTLNTTATTYTFPVTSLCVSEGIASGNNLLALSGVSGDKYIIGIKKIGSAYYVVAKNFGQ